jgi:hypothetical protein
MRKFALYVSALFLGLVAFAQDAPELSEPVDGPKIKFEKESHDFGDITQGDVVEYSFKFTNTGNAPLILSDVRTTCGCTAPEWPRQKPIGPGESENIKVVFNSRGKVGVQNKVITIYSNSVDKIDRIKITTNINLPEKEG